MPLSEFTIQRISPSEIKAASRSKTRRRFHPSSPASHPPLRATLSKKPRRQTPQNIFSSPHRIIFKTPRFFAKVKRHIYLVNRAKIGGRVHFDIFKKNRVKCKVR